MTKHWAWMFDDQAGFWHCRLIPDGAEEHISTSELRLQFYRCMNGERFSKTGGEDVCIRGMKLDGKSDSDANEPQVSSLPFPGLEKLIASTLPFTTADDVIEKLLAAWSEAFSLDNVALLWCHEMTRTAEMRVLRFDSAKTHVQTLRGDLTTTASTFSAAVAKDLIPDSELSWHPLMIGDELVGYLGCEQCSAQFPLSWIDITARLLSTAIHWSEQLTEQKLRALGEYAAGAGHEINNPLAAIGGRASQLLQDEEDPRKRHLLKTIGAQTYRIRDMIGDSMLFAHPPALQTSPLNLAVLIENVVSKFIDEFQARSISLWGNRERDLVFVGDESQICVLISELLKNSIHAVADQGRIEIDCLYETKGVGDQRVFLRVADNGAGFTEEEREHCFDPFYSGRQAGRGLGFGLSKCWRIVQAHGGRILLNISAAGLTEFLVSFPVHPQRK